MAWLKSMMEKEPPEPANPIGTIVCGTLEPDTHDTPKEVVRKALKAAGFRTADVGKGATPQAFIDKAKEVNADVICLTISTITSKANAKKMVDLMEMEGLKGKIGVIMGGAVTKKEDADAIGALWGRTKDEAPGLAKKAMGKK